MSTIIKFDAKELKKLSTDKNSCIIEKKVTQNLALQPWCLGNLKESIKNSLDYKIGKFDKELNGILLCYKNLRVLQHLGSIRNDDADIHFQVQADYFIFSPFVGATLTGIVNKKSTTHLGVLVHKVFNVVIPRPTEAPGNMWIGSNIEEGQEVTFRIVVLDLYGALPYIRGELLESCLKMGPDGDDDDDEVELYEKPSQVYNVPYVDFDKTKPYTTKQIGDGMPHSTSRTQKNNHSRHSTTIGDNHHQDYGKSGSSKTKKTDSDFNIGESSNVKVHNRTRDSDITPKHKKNRRDVHY